MVCTTAGLLALRPASMVIFPVTPAKSFVAATASRMALESVEPARWIACARIRTVSYPSAAWQSGTKPYFALYFWINPWITGS